MDVKAVPDYLIWGAFQHLFAIVSNMVGTAQCIARNKHRIRLVYNFTGQHRTCAGESPRTIICRHKTVVIHPFLYASLGNAGR